MSKLTRVEMPSSNEAMANTLQDFGLDLYSATAEWVDNSVAQGATEVEITCFVENSGQKKLIQIAVSDNGPGMPRAGIEELLAVGYVKSDTAHEHGVGMKVAFSYFGGGSIQKGLNSITSTTTTETFDIQGYEGNYLEIDDTLPLGKNTGCILYADVHSDDHMSKKFDELKIYLEDKYRHYLSKGNTIELVMVDHADSSELRSETLSAGEIPYWDPKAKTKVHMYHEDFDLSGLKGYLRVGVTNADSGIWKASTGRGGLQIVQHDIVIGKRSNLLISGLNHPTYNSVVGEVVITEGHLVTKPKKEIKHSPDLDELKGWCDTKWAEIREAIGLDHTKEGSWSEKDLHEALRTYLKSAPDAAGGNAWKDVDLADNTDTNLEADASAMLVASGKKYVFEAKKDNFTGKDVGQLVNYMAAMGVTHGVAVCRGEAMSSAKAQYAHWKKIWKDLDIQFWDKSHGSNTAIQAELDKVIAKK